MEHVVQTGRFGEPVNPLLPLIAIGVVFAISLLLSYAFTRAQGFGRPQAIDLRAILTGEVRPGTLFETVATAEIVEFTGLQNPPALLLADGDARIQATGTGDVLERLGANGARVVPADPSRLVGKPRTLGTFRIVGFLEDLPVPHIRMIAIASAEPSAGA